MVTKRSGIYKNNEAKKLEYVGEKIVIKEIKIGGKETFIGTFSVKMST